MGWRDDPVGTQAQPGAAGAAAATWQQDPAAAPAPALAAQAHPLQPNQWLGFQDSINNLAGNVDRYGEQALGAIGVKPGDLGLRSAKDEAGRSQAQLQAAALRGQGPGGYGEFAGDMAPWAVMPEMSVPGRVAGAAGLGALQSRETTAAGVTKDAVLSVLGNEGGRVVGKAVGKLAAPLTDVPAALARAGWTPSPGQMFGGPMKAFEGVTQKYLPMVNQAVQRSASTWGPTAERMTRQALFDAGKIGESLGASRDEIMAALDKAGQGGGSDFYSQVGRSRPPAAAPLKSTGAAAAHGGAGLLATVLALKELGGPIMHLVPHELRAPAGAASAAGAGAALVPYTKGARPFFQWLAGPGQARQTLSAALRTVAPKTAGAAGATAARRPGQPPGS